MSISKLFAYVSLGRDALAFVVATGRSCANVCEMFLTNQYYSSRPESICEDRDKHFYCERIITSVQTGR